MLKTRIKLTAGIASLVTPRRSNSAVSNNYVVTKMSSTRHFADTLAIRHFYRRYDLIFRLTLQEKEKQNLNSKFWILGGIDIVKKQFSTMFLP